MAIKTFFHSYKNNMQKKYHRPRLKPRSQSAVLASAYSTLKLTIDENIFNEHDVKG